MFEIRPISPDEYAPFARTTVNAFGSYANDEEIEIERGLFEIDRSLAAFDDGRIVGTGEIFSFELTLPGGATVPAGGVTWIGVLPTHRRRGILTEIMRRQLHDMRERGEPVGMLYASESVIYGRYGYGISTFQATYELDTTHVLERGANQSGRFELLTKEEARKFVPLTYDTWRPTQPGALSRSDAYWDFWFADPERWRHGASARFYLLHRSESGEPDGFISYRVKENWQEGIADSTLRLGLMVALNPAARLDLWRYCFNVDLIRHVATDPFPVEEPLRWALKSPRALRTKSVEDGLWIRLIHIPAALSARRYMSEGAIVFEVTDSFAAENTGCYRLEGGPDGATCRKTTESADISLQVTDLAAIYLGGNRLSTLVRADRAHECTSGAVARADAMFGSDPFPWCGTHF